MCCCKCIHIVYVIGMIFARLYTYISHYNLQLLLRTSFSHHSCCVVNFLRERPDRLFNADSERQIFEKLFLVKFYLLSEFLLEIAEDIFHSYYVLLPDIKDTNPCFTPYKPTHYLLNYDDFLALLQAFQIFTVMLCK